MTLYQTKFFLLFILPIIVAKSFERTFFPTTRCGGNMYGRTGSFALTSSNKSLSSQNNDPCEWRITADFDERIILTVTELDIEKYPNCDLGYLEVRDGYWYSSSLLGKFCGLGKVTPVIATGNKMFVSYVYHNPSRFVATYEAICGGTIFVDRKTYINSPGYPNAYPFNKKCLWRIIVPDNQQVVLYFDTFDVEYQNHCLYDYVEVRDGSALDSDLIGLYCNTKNPPNYITSSGNSLLIKFVSDATVQLGGFSAIIVNNQLDECITGQHKCAHECVNTLESYRCKCRPGFDLAPNKQDCIESSCGGTLTAPTGRIVSPNYPNKYPYNKTCVWEITTQYHNRINLTFDHFDIENSNINGTVLNKCPKDSLRIFHKNKLPILTPSQFCNNQTTWGISEDTTWYEGVYCGNVAPSPIYSDSTILRIEFLSDLAIQETGFAIDYVTALHSCAINNGNCRHDCISSGSSAICVCNGNLTVNFNNRDCSDGDCKFEISSTLGTISSPNYPLNYSNNKNCEWLFTTTPGHRVNVSFSFFHLENEARCLYDNLIFYDGPNSEDSIELGKFCGMALPPPIISSGNEMLAKFKSDSSNVFKGFYATYSPVCGGTFEANTNEQFIYSHADFGYHNYTNETDCQWVISATPGQFVTVVFLEFELENAVDCHSDYVEIYAGINSTKSFYGRYCGSAVPPRVCLVNETIDIRFHTDGRMEAGGFSLMYTITSKSYIP